MIIGVAFNGNLRSFLITPEYSNPIETLEDVVNSGFSIGYMPSGTIVSLGQAIFHGFVISFPYRRTNTSRRARIPS